MVRTQILAFAAADVWEIPELGPLFEDLEIAWDTQQIGPFTLVLAPPSQRDSARTLPTTDVVAAAEVVASGPASATPGAFVGQGTFKPVLIELWRRLPPKFRPDFAFGFSFSPADLQHRKLHLVCAPASLADRWRNYPRRLTAAPGIIPSDGAAFLLGLPEAETLRRFIATANLASPDLENIATYVRVSKYWAERAHLDLSGWIALAKDLTLLAPGDAESESVKKEIAAQLTQRMPLAMTADFLSLRNLKMEAFAAAGGQIAASLADAIRKRLHEPPGGGVDLLEVFRAWLRPASAAWSASVQAGLAGALAAPSNVVAANVWFLWKQDEALFKPVAGLVPATPEAEASWVTTTPAQVSSALLGLLLPWCQARDWWLAHAQVLLASNPWATAITKHLAADGKLDRTAPVRLLLGATDPVAAVAFCVTHADPRARQGGSELCLQQPALWGHFQGSSAGWRDLLEQAWARDATLFDHVPNGGEIRASLLDAWLAGADVSENLLHKVGATRFADLVDYTQCAAALARFPARVRPSFLEATARGWLQRFFRDPPKNPSLDGELRDSVFGPAFTGERFSPQGPNLVRGGLTLLTAFREASETVIREWLEAVAASTERLAPDQIGAVVDLLKHRHWERGALTAKYLAERTHRPDLAAVWDGYWASLGWQDKLLLKLSDVFGNGSAPTSAVLPRVAGRTEKTAVFVTALNLEFDAVCAHLTDLTKRSVGGAVYAVGAFAHRQHRCNVVVALAGMGNAEATLATERAIQNFSPTYAFFVGIAGGLKKELQLGDVVVADKVYAYEAGKAKEAFQSRPKAPNVSYAAIQTAQDVARGHQWRQRIKHDAKQHPKAYVKPIAAGEKVVDSHESDVFKLIAERFGDAYAVAMEDFGFVVAAHATPAVTFAAVRGISDFAHEKSEAEKKDSQAIAAANAAAFAFEMLASFLETAAQPASDKMETHLL